MRRGLLVLGVVAALAILTGLMLASAYNGLVRQRNEVDTAWSKVETQYQRRFDLIPNLVESVKGAQIQEQKVFGDIADARTRYAGARSAEDKAVAANDVESALARLLVIIENYPELRSNENVLALQDQLEGTENRIAVERNRYNDTVKSYNNQVQTFPRTVIAGLFGFEKRSLFEAAQAAEQAPSVDFTPEPTTPATPPETQPNPAPAATPTPQPAQ